MTRAVEIQATSLCNLVRQFTRHAHMGCILLPLISSNSLWVPALRTPSGLQMRVLGFTLIHLRVKPSLPGKEVRSQARRAGREKRGGCECQTLQEGARPGGWRSLWSGSQAQPDSTDRVPLCLSALSCCQAPHTGRGLSSNMQLGPSPPAPQLPWQLVKSCHSLRGTFWTPQFMSLRRQGCRHGPPCDSAR